MSKKPKSIETPGLIVPPLTPFNSKLKVDYKVLEREIDYIVDTCRASCISVSGVETSEYHYLSLEERKELIRKTVEMIDGRIPFVVGISHASYRTSIELAGLAEELGTAALQLLAPLRPFGGAPTTAELVRYFEAVANETAAPILLYLNPGPGADVSVPATIELAKLDRVKYIKESSRDLSRVGRLVVDIDLAGHARYFTTMQMLLATLELGGSGATMPPPGAYIARLIVDAFNEGDLKRAAEIQREFCLFPHKWMAHGLAPVMKAAMEIAGCPVGDPYPPFEGLPAEDKKALAAYLKTTSLFAKERRNAVGKKAVA
ncbi:MAG: dihydrodipicolinate synthase family protein [Rhodospirillaceae bacterium]